MDMSAAPRRVCAVPPAHRPVGVIFLECGEWAASRDRLDLRGGQDGDFPAGLPAEAVWIVGFSSQRLAALSQEESDMSMWEHDQIACLEPEMDRLAVLDGPDVQDLWKGLIWPP